MTALAEASLSGKERQALARLVPELRNRFGARLRAVWLYGSRARGEEPHPESDIDLLIVVDHSFATDDSRVIGVVTDVADTVGVNPVALSTLVYDVDRIAQRRAIRSFFIQEVDRDKIVLYGEP